MREDDDLFEEFDEDDAAGIATHRSFTLQTSQSVPRDAQALGSDIKGRIVLRGRSKRHESQLDSSRIITPGEEEEEEEEKRDCWSQSQAAATQAFDTH